VPKIFLVLNAAIFFTNVLAYLDVGEGFGRTDGANFTPHVITVNAGEVCYEERGL